MDRDRERGEGCGAGVGVFVNWLYFCAIMMVNSGYLSLEKILPPQVVSSLLKGPKERGQPPSQVE